MKKGEMVWLVAGDSESGDKYAAVFRQHPTEAEMKELVHSWDSDEDRDGPGYDGSYVHLTVSSHEVQ
jgi:hypothetical protein